MSFACTALRLLQFEKKIVDVTIVTDMSESFYSRPQSSKKD